MRTTVSWCGSQRKSEIKASYVYSSTSTIWLVQLQALLLPENLSGKIPISAVSEMLHYSDAEAP